MSYEVHVWCENGDPLGSAEVTENEGNKVFPWRVSFNDVDPDSGYAWVEQVFTTKGSANYYAREWAEGYLQWLEATCACWDANDAESGHCGVMSDHGYNIQYIRDGWNVGENG